MINSFIRIMEQINSWSDLHEIPVSSIVDMSGIHGVKIFDKSKDKLRKLLESLYPILKDENIFMDKQRVRGGTLLAFSRKALSESDIYGLLNAIGENKTMSFHERMDAAMHGAPSDEIEAAPAREVKRSAIDFTSQARRINEAQYKSATQGMLRSNQSSLQRNTHGVDLSFAGKRKTSKQPAVKESSGLHADTHSTVRFANKILEALEGMATPTGTQPSDILERFAQALREVGTRTGSGPIQDRLKERGIKAKTENGQEIILYVINNKTNAPQPIARISAETIANPTKFQEALQDMIDLSQGNEPGAFESYRTKMQEQEKAVREVAKTLAPVDPASVEAATQAATPKVMPQQQV